MKVTLKEQEQQGNYKFNGQVYFTRGIEETFDIWTFKLVADTFSLIRPLIDSNIADYFQVVEVDMENGEKVTVWVIDDVTHITFLLPSEY